VLIYTLNNQFIDKPGKDLTFAKEAWKYRFSLL